MEIKLENYVDEVMASVWAEKRPMFIRGGKTQHIQRSERRHRSRKRRGGEAWEERQQEAGPCPGNS